MPSNLYINNVSVGSGTRLKLIRIVWLEEYHRDECDRVSVWSIKTKVMAYVERLWIMEEYFPRNEIKEMDAWLLFFGRNVSGVKLRLRREPLSCSFLNSGPLTLHLSTPSHESLFRTMVKGGGPVKGRGGGPCPAGCEHCFQESSPEGCGLLQVAGVLPSGPRRLPLIDVPDSPRT